jgi:hypothetical protein
LLTATVYFLPAAALLAPPAAPVALDVLEAA